MTTVNAWIGDPSDPESIALDLYGNDETMPEAVVPEEEFTTDAISALVHRYTKTEGSFGLTADSRLYIVTDSMPSDELLSTVRLIDAEMATSGIPGSEALPVVWGYESDSKAGDIVVKSVLSDDLDIDITTADIGQSYRMDIGEKVVITGCDPQGIYYGLVTLMQMAISAGAVDSQVEIECCSIEDGPALAERTLFLDCGRKYFSVDFIENLIRRASFQRYNAIELHFTEDKGIRLDSEKFPWLTDGIKSLSREEMAEIIRLARTYQMEVIPSIDVPGHTRYMIEKYEEYVKAHPDWSFDCDGKTYSGENTAGFGSIANHYSYNGETRASNYIGIDITQEHAVAFANALIDDYASFFASFGCNKFNFGGDEILGWDEFVLGGKGFNYENRWESLEHWGQYAKDVLEIENGSASDTYINYLNTVATRLEDQGYRCRMFNDEINLNDDQHLELKSSVEINCWNGSVKKLSKYTKDGHVLHNDISKWCYYVIMEIGGDDIMNNNYKAAYAKAIYNNWDPRSFSSKKNEPITVPADNLGGAYFHIWCDDPDYKDAATVWRETELRTWANSCKMWNPDINSVNSGSGKTLKYKSLKKFAKNLGSFPGYTGDPDSPAVLAEPAPLTGRLSLVDRLLGWLR